MGRVLPLGLPPAHTGRAEQMESHQQQPESPRAKTGVEDRVSGLLPRQAILQTNLCRLWPRVFPNDLKGHSLEDLVGRLGRLARLLGDKELHFMLQAVAKIILSAAGATGVASKGREVTVGK